MRNKYTTRTLPKMIVGGAVALLSTTTLAPADTLVAGPIFGDVTWTAAASPYCMTGSVVVGLGSTLTIEPGVIIRVNPGLGLQVGSDGFGDGILVARGTPTDPIIFMGTTEAPDIPLPGDWNGISFTDVAIDASFSLAGDYESGSILEHVVVEYAGGGSSSTGAITIESSSPYLTNVTVRDSSRAGVYANLSSAPPIRIEDSRFERCVHSGQGGGMYMTNATNPKITGNLFDSNSASEGGGAYISATQPVVSDNVASSNASTSNQINRGGGGMLVTGVDAVVTDNTVVDNTCVRNGGGLKLSGSNVTVSGNIIDGNSATTGGGIEVSGSAFQMSSNEIRQNTASTAGGVNLLGSAHAFSDNLVMENQATSSGGNGGGMYVSSQTTSLGGNTFSSNTSAGRGGGLYVAASGATMFGDIITENFAATDGGGAYVGGSGVTMTECAITDNEAASDGGGLYWQGTGGSLAGTKGGPCNTITGNIAPIGDAVYYDRTFAGDGQGDLDAAHVCWGTTDPAEVLAMIHDYFDDGGLSIVRTTPFMAGPILADTTWSLADSPFVVMESVVVGEGACLTIEAGVLIECEPDKSLSAGTATFGSSCIVARGTQADPIVMTSSLDEVDRAAGDWTSVYFGAFADDAVFDENGDYESGSILEHVVVEYAGGGSSSTGAITIESSSPYLTNVTVRDSSRAGVYANLSSAPPIRIEDSQFERCVHSGQGGGLYMTNATNPKITGNLFDSNSASEGGGAYISATQPVVSDNVASSNASTSNQINRGGGGMLVTGVDAVVTDNTVVDNTCVRNGGGLKLSGSNVTVSGNIIDGNSATTGGGIEVSGSAFQMSSNEIRQNTASTAGGVNLLGSAHAFSDNLVMENQATSSGGNGGGMYVSSQTTSLGGNTFSSNTSAGRGGGLYVAASGATMFGDIITENFAATDGGGAYVGGSSVTMTECTITDNEAASDGGGLYWQGTGGSLVGDEDAYNVLTSNTALNGSALYYDVANGNDLVAQHVCWGTDDANMITLQIHDFFDNASLGFVFFAPFIADANCADDGDACIGDVNGDEMVGFTDLVSVQASWGPCPGGGTPCNADLNGDEEVSFLDLVALLSNWGPCPN